MRRVRVAFDKTRSSIHGIVTATFTPARRASLPRGRHPPVGTNAVSASSPPSAARGHSLEDAYDHAID
jgi:hypothetical protein